MIDDLRLLFPQQLPDLNSLSYIELLGGVSSAQAWVRMALVVVGLALIVLVILLLTQVRLTVPGLVVTGLLAFGAASALLMNQRLREDLRPYQLEPRDLSRYQVVEARLTSFGRWTSFGSPRNRFERLYWTRDGVPELSGRTPFVRAIYSAWLDLDDTVYIGLDPTGHLPPIFLGVTKPGPEILLRTPPATLREIVPTLQEAMKRSRRWKGNYLRSPFGG